MKILILCSANSCRSQMAQGILQSFDREIVVASAGTNPAPVIHPLAVEVMKEIDIDISKNHPVHINNYIEESWDSVITVCDSANENCPTFNGNVKSRLHINFDDPVTLEGSLREIIPEFRRIRDQIQTTFIDVYSDLVYMQ